MSLFVLAASGATIAASVLLATHVVSESSLFARGAIAAIVAVSAIPAITAVSGYQGMTSAVNATGAPPAALVIPHPLTLLTDTWLSIPRNPPNSSSTPRADLSL